jgi:hypothetical protein
MSDPNLFRHLTFSCTQIGSTELEECSIRFLQDYMSSISKLIEEARKHILEIHDFCTFFGIVEEQMSHVNSLLDESKKLYERLLAMRLEIFLLLHILFSPLLQPLLNTRLFALMTWLVVASLFQLFR